MQEINNNKLTKEDQNHHGIVEPPNSLPTEIRFGAPNGPRQQRNEKYDGHKPLGVCPRFSIRGSRGGSFVINVVNGTTDLGWEPLPGKLWHRKVVSVGRFHNPFHQERACYP
jgi:hypothetical protein